MAQWIGNPAWPVSAGAGWQHRCWPAWPGRPTSTASTQISCVQSSPGCRPSPNAGSTPAHDRDQDGFPEWDHPLQTGLEDNPAFTVWQAGGQGAAISAAESPALSAMLYREILSLAHIAGALDQPGEQERLESRAAQLRLLTEACWDDSAALYHNRDRATHRSPAGKTLGRQSGVGKLTLDQSFPAPVRLLVRIKLTGEATRRPEIILHGQEEAAPRSESLERMDFQWGPGLAVATSRPGVYPPGAGRNLRPAITRPGFHPDHGFLQRRYQPVPAALGRHSCPAAPPGPHQPDSAGRRPLLETLWPARLPFWHLQNPPNRGRPDNGFNLPGRSSPLECAHRPGIAGLWDCEQRPPSLDRPADVRRHPKP